MTGELQQSNGTAPARRRSLLDRFAERMHADPAQLMASLKATVFRQRDGSAPTNEQLMALIAVADQYGLNPFTKEIYAFPDDRGHIIPVVSVDGWSRIINGHSDTDGIEFRFASERVELEGLKAPMPEWCEAIIYHKTRAHPTVVREYMDEVYRPPFETKYGKTIRGPWQSHPRRMLRHKTLIQAGRVAFGFGGIYDPDEADRIVEARRAEDGSWVPAGGASAPGAGSAKTGGLDGLRDRLGGGEEAAPVDGGAADAEPAADEPAGAAPADAGADAPEAEGDDPGAYDAGLDDLVDEFAGFEATGEDR